MLGQDPPDAQSLCGVLALSRWVIAAQQASGPLDHQFPDGRTGGGTCGSPPGEGPRAPDLESNGLPRSL